jgi:hypothetical protein
MPPHGRNESRRCNLGSSTGYRAVATVHCGTAGHLHFQRFDKGPELGPGDGAAPNTFCRSQLCPATFLAVSPGQSGPGFMHEQIGASSPSSQ